jgi:acetolactate decarboxylase
VFGYENTNATIVGFWSPEYTQAIAIAGYHLHAISDDRSRGGHVFDVQASHLRVDVHRVTDLHLALPETEAFLTADLGGSTIDITDLEQPAR